MCVSSCISGVFQAHFRLRTYCLITYIFIMSQPRVLRVQLSILFLIFCFLHAREHLKEKQKVAWDYNRLTSSLLCDGYFVDEKNLRLPVPAYSGLGQFQVDFCLCGKKSLCKTKCMSPVHLLHGCEAIRVINWDEFVCFFLFFFFLHGSRK